MHIYDTYTRSLREKKSEEKRVAVAKHKCRFLESNVCVCSTREKKKPKNIILEKKVSILNK